MLKLRTIMSMTLTRAEQNEFIRQAVEQAVRLYFEQHPDKTFWEGPAGMLVALMYLAKIDLSRYRMERLHMVLRSMPNCTARVPKRTDPIYWRFERI